MKLYVVGWEGRGVRGGDISRPCGETDVFWAFEMLAWVGVITLTQNIL